MRPRARPALAVLFLVNVLNIYDRQAFGAILEPLRRDFRLSDTELGMIPTLFTVIYALAGLPLGRLADRVSRKRLLAGSGGRLKATLIIGDGAVKQRRVHLVLTGRRAGR